MEENEGGGEIVEKDEFAMDITGSEEMELNHILEKIEHFTELVTIHNDFVYVVEQRKSL